MEAGSVLSPYVSAAQDLRNFDWESLIRNASGYKVDALEAVRISAFKLQSLGRVLRKSAKKNQEWTASASSLRDDAKFVEDVLGRVLYAEEMHSSVKMGEFGSDINAFSLQNLSVARNDFVRLVKPIQSRSQKIYKELGFLENPPKSPRDLYLKGLRRNLKKIARQTAEDIDPTLLEDGTHELRRKLRWVVMGFIYPQGLFGYVDSQAEKAVSSYTRLVPEPLFEPIGIESGSLFLISKMVGDLGKIKDAGLESYYLKRIKGDESVDYNMSTPENVVATEEILEQLRLKKPIESLLSALD